jgi:ribosomal protein S18 acetylase RimI-like enzyme
MDIILRKSKTTDEHHIGKIIIACHWERPVADHELLALRWIRQYLVTEPQNCYVLEHPHTQKVIGYILCASDTIAYENEFEKTYLQKIKDRFEELKKQSFEYLEENRKLLFFRPSLDFGFDMADYPAHLHINILPEFQRSGCGEMLLSAYEANLRSRGIHGYHLCTGANNIKGISFYKKKSLELLHTVYKDDKPATCVFGKKLY